MIYLIFNNIIVFQCVTIHSLIEPVLILEIWVVSRFLPYTNNAAIKPPCFKKESVEYALNPRPLEFKFKTPLLLFLVICLLAKLGCLSYRVSHSEFF